MEELDAGGEALIANRLGPFASDGQAAEIRDKIAAEVSSVKKEHEGRNARSSEEAYAQKRETDFENFVEIARQSPVFGGELDPDEKERLVKSCRASLERSKNRYDNWKPAFFYIEDMNGDGEPDILMGIANDIYLLRWDRAFKLEMRTKNYKTDGADNKTVISSGDQRILKNRWDMLRINERIFFIEPDEILEIESQDNHSL
jgi:hypothetical protein